LLVVYAVTGPGHIEVENTGTLVLFGVVTENVTFTSGSTGMLVLGNPKSDTGTITGFSKTGTNTLVLANLPFAVTTTGVYTGTTTSGVLTVTEGSNVATINLIGDYLGQTFTLSSYPGGSTEVVDPTRDPAPQLTPSATLSPHTFIAAMAGGYSDILKRAQLLYAIGVRRGSGRGGPSPTLTLLPALESAP
jgi:hypothetical protein